MEYINGLFILLMGECWEYQHDWDINGIFGYTGWRMVGMRHPVAASMAGKSSEKMGIRMGTPRRAKGMSPYHDTSSDLGKTNC